MSTSRSSSFYFDDFLDEEEFQIEPKYVGMTSAWLRRGITILSQIADLNAYKKFNAAVKIQAIIRGWLTRRRIKRLNEAAVRIQKTWRGLLGRWRYYQILEWTVQKQTIEHHIKSATIIQTIFRGYYSRKYIHDHVKLKKLEKKVTSELLTCVALQTRKLFKNQYLPGVLSLRNSECRTKVEKLLAVLNIKKYNEEVRRNRSLEVAKFNKAIERSIEMKDVIPIPVINCRAIENA